MTRGRAPKQRIVYRARTPLFLVVGTGKEDDCGRSHRVCEVHGQAVIADHQRRSLD